MSTNATQNAEDDGERKEVTRVEAGTPVNVIRPRMELDLSTPEGILMQQKRIEAMVDAQANIRRALIKLTNQADWVDEGGKPYLQYTGTTKIAGAYGLSFDPPEYMKSFGEHPEEGPFVEFEVMTMVHYNGRSLPEIGSASSRDDFFSKRKKWNDQTQKSEIVRLPVSEVDLQDVKKKALTNLLNRAVKNMLGISYTWDEIEEASGGRISREGGASFKFEKGKKGGNTDAAPGASVDNRAKVRKMLLEICFGDESAAKERLKALTTFKGKDGMVPGKASVNDVSEKQLEFLVPKVEKEYEEFLKSQGPKAPAPEAPVDNK